MIRACLSRDLPSVISVAGWLVTLEEYFRKVSSDSLMLALFVAFSLRGNSG